MREVESPEELYATSPGFSSRSLADYNSDFACLPEFFNAPLTGTVWIELIKMLRFAFLAGYTEWFLKTSTPHLAVKLYRHVITGSMPFLDDDDNSYITSVICAAVNGTVEEQRKIQHHPAWSVARGWLKGAMRSKYLTLMLVVSVILVCVLTVVPKQLARLMAFNDMEYFCSSILRRYPIRLPAVTPWCRSTADWKR